MSAALLVVIVILCVLVFIAVLASIFIIPRIRDLESDMQIRKKSDIKEHLEEVDAQDLKDNGSAIRRNDCGCGVVVWLEFK